MKKQKPVAKKQKSALKWQSRRCRQLDSVDKVKHCNGQQTDVDNRSMLVIATK